MDKEVFCYINKINPGYQLLNFFPLSIIGVFIQICLIGGQRQPAGHPIGWNPNNCNFCPISCARLSWICYCHIWYIYILRSFFISCIFKIVTEQWTSPFKLRNWCSWACSIPGMSQELSPPMATWTGGRWNKLVGDDQVEQSWVGNSQLVCCCLVCNKNWIVKAKWVAFAAQFNSFLGRKQTELIISFVVVAVQAGTIDFQR